MSRFRLRRWRRDGVRPREVWDLPLRAGAFWQLAGAPRVAELRAQGAGEVEIGRALWRSVEEALQALRPQLGWAAAALGGGLTAQPGFEEAVRAAPTAVSIHVLPGGAWAGEPGGRALLAETGAPDGVVIDVGQTAVKASAGAHRVLRPRDLARLPLRLIGADGHSRGGPVAEAAAFLAGAAVELLQQARPAAPRLVLALPSAIDERGVPGACTYGWEGEAELLPRLCAHLDASGLAWPGREVEVLLLNDAELAAESARLLLPARPLLVLTLGFGPGGALVEGL